MSNDTIRVAITAALRRRGTIDDLDVTPSLTLLGSRTSTASVVIYGPDGAVIDVVARAGDDAKALRGVAFAVGLRVAPCPACSGRGRRAYAREVEDGCDECECSGVVVIDPAEDVERLRAELAEARATIDQFLSVIGAHNGEVARLEFALQCEATRHEATRAAVREHLAAEAACDDARITLGEMSLIHDTPDAIRAADEAVTAASLRLISSRKALRKIVEGDR